MVRRLSDLLRSRWASNSYGAAADPCEHLRSVTFMLALGALGAIYGAITAARGQIGTAMRAKVVQPPHQASGFVIFFSDRNGSTPADDAAARAISAAGALVAEVDTRAYLNRVNKVDEKCHRLVDEAEWFSRQTQRELGFRNYLTPIVAGVGEGGTLAGLVLAQASAATIAGAVSIDPSVTIATRRPICTTGSAEARAGGFRYGSPKQLQGFWTVGLTFSLARANRDYVMGLRRDGAPLQLHEIGPNREMADALRALIEPPRRRGHPHRRRSPLRWRLRSFGPPHPGRLQTARCNIATRRRSFATIRRRKNPFVT